MQANLVQLRAFLAVAECLHFGRAARRLHVAQPSVSQHVARLERQVGTRLFVRDPGGVRLTAAGEQLAREVGPAVRQLDEVLDGFGRRHGVQAPLRVGALSSLAVHLLPRAAVKMRSLGSNVDLRESGLTTLTHGVRDGLLDVGFCYSTRAPDALHGLVVEVLDRRPVSVALPEQSMRVAQGLLSWSKLDGRDWIMPSASRQYRDDMLGRFERRGVRVRVVAEATSLSSQLALVAAGIGATFTSPWVPAVAGVHVAEIDDEETLDLLAVHIGDLRPDARDLIDAVSRLAASVQSPAHDGR